MKLRLPILLSVTLVSGACTSPTSDSAADSVFVNGTFYTSDNDIALASAVAVRDGEFVFVGDDASAFIDPETNVYDLGGKAVIPGLIDAHSHPGLVAMSANVQQLDDTSSMETLMASIRKMVTEDTTSDILIGGFWPNEYFGVRGPTREELDQIEPDRPLILYDSWAHTVWVNSRALEQAGVSRETDDVVPGFAFYQRDQDGRPTGWITESAATLFVNKFQSVTPAMEDALLEYLEYYRSVGVTTVLDAGNFGLDRDIYAVISRLDKEGRLPVRYHGAYTLFVPSDLDGAVETLEELGEEFNSENVRIDTLKLFFDGILETRTAAVSDEYLDTPENKGNMLLSRQQVHKLIVDLDEAGLNLHVHAVGNQSTSRILNAVEDTHESLGRAPAIRITICHLEVVEESDIDRFENLGVVANFTPHWWVGGDMSWVAQGIGDKAENMQRARSFIDAGATVTFSSDITDRYEWKSDRANPFVGMQVGHNRQDVGVDPEGDVMPPNDERVERIDLLTGYTSNAANQLDRSDEIGSIAVGKRADLVVLDRNVLEIDRYEIHETKPVAVVTNGEIVFGTLATKN
ncbi:MAG: amidohydrolase [Woeseiaceae bacterium]